MYYNNRALTIISIELRGILYYAFFEETPKCIGDYLGPDITPRTMSPTETNNMGAFTQPRQKGTSLGPRIPAHGVWGYGLTV